MDFQCVVKIIQALLFSHFFMCCLLLSCNEMISRIFGLMVFLKLLILSKIENNGMYTEVLLLWTFESPRSPKSLRNFKSLKNLRNHLPPRLDTLMAQKYCDKCSHEMVHYCRHKKCTQNWLS